jgi:hypothetical protein
MHPPLGAPAQPCPWVGAARTRGGASRPTRQPTGPADGWESLCGGQGEPGRLEIPRGPRCAMRSIALHPEVQSPTTPRPHAAHRNCDLLACLRARDALAASSRQTITAAPDQSTASQQAPGDIKVLSLQQGCWRSCACGGAGVQLTCDSPACAQGGPPDDETSSLVWSARNSRQWKPGSCGHASPTTMCLQGDPSAQLRPARLGASGLSRALALPPSDQQQGIGFTRPTTNTQGTSPRGRAHAHTHTYEPRAATAAVGLGWRCPPPLSRRPSPKNNRHSQHPPRTHTPPLLRLPKKG